MIRWRRRIFASTWLCYVGLYFARKPFFIVKKDLGDAMQFSASDLGLIGSAYLIAHGGQRRRQRRDRFGARKLLLVGKASLLANLVLGVANGLSASVFGW